MNYRALFLIGLLLLAGGVIAGVYHSLQTDGQLPVLSLTEVVERHFNETNDLLRAGEFERALEQAQLAERLLSRDRHVVMNNIGRAYLGLKDPQRAIEALDASIRLDPAYAPAHNHLGIAHAAAGNDARAAESFREALRIDPQSQSARENLSRLTGRLDRSAAEPAGTAESAELASGRAYARQFHDGELAALREHFAPLFASRMSQESLVDLHRRVLQELGAETELVDERVVRVRDSNLYVRRANHEKQRGTVELLISMTDTGTINGIVLQPASASDSPK